MARGDWIVELEVDFTIDLYPFCPPRVKVVAAVSGPLCVLPSPSLKCAALLLKIGDLAFSCDLCPPAGATHSRWRFTSS